MKIILRLSLVLLCIGSNLAGAHDRSESFSEWTWRENTVNYSFSVLQRELTRVPAASQQALGLDAILSAYLSEHISVSIGDQSCAVAEAPRALKSRGGFLYAEGGFLCPAQDPVASEPTITLNTFFDLVASHTHYAKVRHQGQVQEFLLTPDRRSETLRVSGETGTESLGGWQAFKQYLGVGSEHILAGADHLAFLFGLILLASGWREMAWLITGFTLGHSISLALAVLGAVQPNGVMVEALIGFTIVLVAIEAAGERADQLPRVAPWLLVLCLLMVLPVWWVNAQWQLIVGILGAGLFSLCYLQIVRQVQRRAVFRLLVTSTFGVIHGFGFAGGLLTTDFDIAERAFVLLGFNLGVELGQLSVLAVVIAVVVVVKRFASSYWQQRGADATVAALSGLGTFWFASRLLT
jgi:hypothetical protein